MTPRWPLLALLVIGGVVLEVAVLEARPRRPRRPSSSSYVLVSPVDVGPNPDAAPPDSGDAGIWPDAAVVPTWENITLYGQSLSLGTLGTPVQNTSVPAGYDVEMVNAGNTALVALTETTGVESPGSSLGYTYHYLEGQTTKVIVTGHGLGGTAYSGLAQGTAPYIAGEADVAFVDGAGAAEVVAYRAMHFIHGEADQEARSASYAANLSTLQTDWESDLQASTGYAASVPMITDQCSRLDAALTYSLIAIQQLAAARSDPDIYLVGPKYQYGYQDTYHMDGPSYEALGAQHGKVAYAVASGAGWQPLQPNSITATGKDVIVAMDVPVTPIVLDTTTLPTRTDYGFEYFDPVTRAAPVIESVAVTGSDEVTISLSAPPRTGSYIRYAYTPPTPSAHPWGNIRDSDATDLGPHVTTADARNWLVHFDDAITAGTVAPQVSVATGYTATDSGAYVQVASPSIGGSALTLSWWMRHTGQMTSFNDIIDASDSGNWTMRVRPYVSGTYDSLQIQLAGNIIARSTLDTNELTDGAWHHYAVVYNGAAALQIYIDGVAVTMTPGGIPPASMPASTGHFQVNAASGQAGMDIAHVAYWTVAADAGDIGEIAYAPRDLVTDAIDLGDPVIWLPLDPPDTAGSVRNLGTSGITPTTVGLVAGDFITGGGP